VNGKRIRQENHSTIDGNLQLQLNLEALPEGIYLLSLSGSEGVLVTQRIVIQ
jgi:hypothetical protein